MKNPVPPRRRKQPPPSLVADFRARLREARHRRGALTGGIPAAADLIPPDLLADWTAKILFPQPSPVPPEVSNMAGETFAAIGPDLSRCLCLSCNQRADVCPCSNGAASCTPPATNSPLPPGVTPMTPGMARIGPETLFIDAAEQDIDMLVANHRNPAISFRRDAPTQITLKASAADLDQIAAVIGGDGQTANTAAETPLVAPAIYGGGPVANYGYAPLVNEPTAKSRGGPFTGDARKEHVMRVAAELRAKGVAAEVVIQAALDANNADNDPPLSDGQVYDAIGVDPTSAAVAYGRAPAHGSAHGSAPAAGGPVVSQSADEAPMTVNSAVPGGSFEAMFAADAAARRESLARVRRGGRPARQQSASGLAPVGNDGGTGEAPLTSPVYNFAPPSRGRRE